MKVFHFYALRRTKYIFTCRVIEPEAYAGLDLYMYARYLKSWKRIPPSAKLYKAACVVLGRRLRHNEKIFKSMFVGKVVRAQLRNVPLYPNGPDAYSIVDFFWKSWSADEEKNEK